MWNYTKCTAANREEQLKALETAFQEDKDCSAFLSEVQAHINSTQTSIVLLQDLEWNRLIEMDYVPVNDYVFRIVTIEHNGMRTESLPCATIHQAIRQFCL